MRKVASALTFIIFLVDHPRSEAGNVQCDLYLADSTIPNAGLGIFTSVTKEKGDTIGNGDVCIPFLDIYWHNDDDFFFPMLDYVWDGRVMGMQLEVEDDDINAYWPGMDCAVNCNLALLNVAKATPAYDETLHRWRHPGAGSSSPYHEGVTAVTRTIPAGGELFKYYGDEWFTTRFSVFGNIPLWDDFDTALQLLRKVAKMDRSIRSSLHHFLVDSRDVWDSRALNALPDKWKQGIKAIKANNMGALHQDNATRSLEWLEENGKCISLIVPGDSTIDGAGHGGFAKHFIPKGNTITGSPLHHIPDRKIFNMYDFEPEIGKDGKYRRSEQIIGHQVALNYCFGHSETSLLLCPYGAGVNYVNHNKTNANVQIRWARDKTTGHNDTWLETTPAEMTWNYKTGLAFDYVATKDIALGEELFLDYGDGWEQAWKEHVANWKPSDYWRDYISAAEYNDRYAAYQLRTTDEQKDEPYPDNLKIHCHSYLLSDGYRKSQPKLGNDPKFQWTTSDKGYPCKIQASDDKKETYTILMTYGKAKYQVEREGVMRQAISFVDIPYSTDIHLLKAFRHPLEIPNDLVPDIWKNA